MNAEILAVGTELLLGDIVNTNAEYLSKRLAELGISVYYQSVVGDNKERLLNAFKIAFDRSDIVITTGGLGPTKDDLTKEVGAEFFNKKLYLHEESLKNIEDYFKRTGRSLNEGNRKQAYIPEGATVLKNNNGTAPGCLIDENNKVLVFLPGPPKEMSLMFEESVVPYLKKYSNLVFESRVLRILGIGEGIMAEKIDDIIENQTNPTVAPYAKEGEVILRITASAKTKDEAVNLIKPMEEKLRERLGEDIYGVGETSIEEVTGKLLMEKGLTISTAESCTGGLLSGRLINVSGISATFIQGAVTYSNESKIKTLGVNPETLNKYGAVSEQTATEMAQGIARISGTNIALSTTGVAGPDGGTIEKPVGLVYVGLYINGKTMTKKLNLFGNREKIRNRAVNEALDWLRRELIK